MFVWLLRGRGLDSWALGSEGGDEGGEEEGSLRGHGDGCDGI